MADQSDHDLVKELWPEVPALHRVLQELTRGTHKIGVTDRDIDRIHEGLLRKKRSGSLGLHD